jgi:hypothetical protein
MLATLATASTKDCWMPLRGPSALAAANAEMGRGRLTVK